MRSRVLQQLITDKDNSIDGQINLSNSPTQISNFLHAHNVFILVGFVICIFILMKTTWAQNKKAKIVTFVALDS